MPMPTSRRSKLSSPYREGERERVTREGGGRRAIGCRFRTRIILKNMNLPERIGQPQQPDRSDKQGVAEVAETAPCLCSQHGPGWHGEIAHYYSPPSPPSPPSSTRLHLSPILLILWMHFQLRFLSLAEERDEP
jgi:hypothetical protein